MAAVILGIGALVFLAHLFGIVFQRTRVPDVLLLMAVGIILGPLTGLIQPQHLGAVGSVMSTVALVVILFESGTTLDLRVLARAVVATSRLALLTFVTTFAIVALVGYLALDLSILASLLLGAILGNVSAAVVIPLVKGLRLGDRTATLLILESALSDVLSIVLVFGIITAEVTGEVSPFRMVGTVLSAMVFAAVLGVIGGIAWLRVLVLVRRLPHTLFASVAFVFLVYGVSELLGYSGAIAALAFGVTLENHSQMGLDKWARLRTEHFASLTSFEQQFFAEVVFLLQTFFFVYLGVSLQFGAPVLMGVALLIVAFVYASRILVALRSVKRETPRHDVVVVSAMVPKGLAAAVLAGIPFQEGIAGGDTIRTVAYAVVLLSITLTAVLVWGMDRRPLAGFYARVFADFPEQAQSGAEPSGPAPPPSASGA